MSKAKPKFSSYKGFVITRKKTEAGVAYYSAYNGEKSFLCLTLADTRREVDKYVGGAV